MFEASTIHIGMGIINDTHSENPYPNPIDIFHHFNYSTSASTKRHQTTINPRGIQVDPYILPISTIKISAEVWLHDIDMLHLGTFRWISLETV